MPRVALISDIHANLEALRVVLDDIERAEPDAVFCLGDVVGYGPEPDECVELVEDFCDLVVIGNHDEAAIAGATPATFTPSAAAGIRFAVSRLEDRHVEVMRRWPRRAAWNDLLLAHATFGSRAYEYVNSPAAASRAFAGLPRSDAPLIGVIGHTHLPSAFWTSGAAWSEPDGEDVGAVALPHATRFRLRTDRRHILNPGSVGQPRDDSPDAAWAMLDTTARTVEVRRAPYDVEATRRKLELAGLPQRLRRGA